MIRVPQDSATIESAIDASQPGTLILVDRGVYPGGIIVPESRPGITIRGVERNSVILDGADGRETGIEVLADDVAIENMSAHNFTQNGIYWEAVDGFAGRYLTVWNVGLYGIYAIESHDGTFEESYVSGAADAAFYIGECNPCDTTIRNVVARHSAIGYSGTNAGGNLEVRDSLWELNGSGIMPNSYEGQEAPPPQRSSRITGNTIRGSGSVPVPASSPLAGYLGVGIAIAGGWENIVEGNEISDSAAYGIALFPTIQFDGSAIQPKTNVIRSNQVNGSGKADLAVAQGSATGNCFEGNQYEMSLPPDIESALGCAAPATSSGDPSVLAELGVPVPEALARLGPRPPYQDMPVPGDQTTMPNVGEASSPARVPSDLILLGLALLALLGASLFVIAQLYSMRTR